MKITFNWIGGATFILSIDDLKIAVDPVLCRKGTIQDYFWFKSVRIEDPIYSKTDFQNIDIWLITHKHKDHLDDLGLSKISKDTMIVSNYNTAPILLDKDVKKLTVLRWKQSQVFKIKKFTIQITAIPAIHGVNPVSAFFAGNVNGYFISISKGTITKTIYITGDTVYKKKVVQALINKKINLLIANMGAAQKGTWMMTLTLTTKMLKKMMSKLQPDCVIPVHYGTFSHYNESVNTIKSCNDNRLKIVSVGSKTILSL